MIITFGMGLSIVTVITIPTILSFLLILPILIAIHSHSAQAAMLDRITDVGASQPDDMEAQDDTAFASQQETQRGILSVLRFRQNYLRMKGISDMRRVLTPEERGELVKAARNEYEATEEQQALQQRDKEEATARAEETACACHKSVANFVRKKKRSRWCLHLQRTCGTKELWEILSFTGRFDPEIFRDPQELAAGDPDDEEERPVAAGSARGWSRRVTLRASSP